jgi:hypothetical protein
MAVSRYKKDELIKNNDEDYKKVFSSRFGSLGLIQRSTNTIKRPTETELLEVDFFADTWGLGKRLYKYADQYYGDSQYWWIIALFNNIGSESDLNVGDLIKIPTPLDKMLNLYGF